MLNSIIQKSEQTDELLNIMFEYTKLSSGSFTLSVEKIDLGRLLREIVAGSYDNFEKKRITIDVDIPEMPIYALIDKIEMRRALANLIINAYSHNESNSKVWVALKSDPDSGICIIIADNGAEISPDEREKLFVPFICGDDSRTSTSGTGLGLSITKAIIEKHGYKISIKDMDKPYKKAFVVTIV